MRDLTPWASADKTPAAGRVRLSETAGRRHVATRKGQPRRYGFDAAVTNDNNRRHWAAADGLSADAAASVEIRRLLRNRGRYETKNNSYARGIVNTLGIDTVGPCGPRLQMLLGEEKELAALIEQDWSDWAREVRLAEKLRTLRMTRAEGGEGFGLLTTNKKLAHEVKLDVRVYESEQVSDPTPIVTTDPNLCDGITYDDNGNPVTYRFLKRHPGDMGPMLFAGDDYEDVPAALVLHYFRPDRPGQRRGIPDMTPALPLFAQLRRMSQATLDAAETAAHYSAVIQSDAPPNADDAEQPDVMDTFELERNQAVVLPQGWKLGQMEAEHPTTSYETFVNAVLREIARCLNMPFSIAAQDSSKANMSAAYLDHQIYAKSIKVDREDLELLVERIFDAWLTEWIRVQRVARTLPAELLAAIERVGRFFHQWFWPAIGKHADPAKVANGRLTELAAGLTTIPRECAADGVDWEDEQEQAAKSLGISVDDYRKLLRQKLFGAPPAAAPAGGAGGASDSTDTPDPQDDNADQEDDAAAQD